MSLHAVVPVKAFACAKQRLQGCCTPAQRHALARLMLQDVLDVLLATPGLHGVAVVTADAEAAMLARRHGAAVLDEPVPGGLNPALAAAARQLAARGCGGMLVVPGDVPGLTRAELARLLAVHEQPDARAPRLTLVPARDGRGTNALALSPPAALAPAFGEDSFARHRDAARAAGLRTRELALPGLGLDLDHADDLARFAAHRSPTRTWHFLAALAPGGPAAARPATPARRLGAPMPHASHP